MKEKHWSDKPYHGRFPPPGQVPSGGSGGVKADAGKVPMELLSPNALKEIAKVLKFGAEKYAPRNWEKGLDYSRVYGAALRHLLAWWDGEDKDDETGLSHVSHAACCLMFLSHYVSTGRTDLDNRPHRVVDETGDYLPLQNPKLTKYDYKGWTTLEDIADGC